MTQAKTYEQKNPSASSTARIWSNVLLWSRYNEWTVSFCALPMLADLCEAYACEVGVM